MPMARLRFDELADPDRKALERQMASLGERRDHREPLLADLAIRNRNALEAGFEGPAQIKDR